MKIFYAILIVFVLYISVYLVLVGIGDKRYTRANEKVGVANYPAGMLKQKNVKGNTPLSETLTITGFIFLPIHALHLRMTDDGLTLLSQSEVEDLNVRMQKGEKIFFIE
jgi:hypothetical protein